MRVLPIVIGVLWVAMPVHAIAKPKAKIAVAPLAGDAGNKVAAAVVEALGKDFTVVGPKEVGREMTRLGLPDELDAKATRKLAQKLGVVAVIDGKVGKAGGKRSLHLEVHRRGKPDAGFTVAFTSATSAKFRRAVYAEIDKKLEGAGDDPAADDDAAPRAVAQADDGDRKRKPPASGDDDEARPSRKLTDDDGDRKRKPPASGDDDGDRKRKPPASGDNDGDDQARRPRRPAGDQGGRRRVAAADGEDEGAARKRKPRKRDDDAAAQLAARVGAGASVAQRQLSFDTRTGFQQIPPRVLTTAGAGRIDGEIYPFLLADEGSGLAGLGLAATYDKTFGLAIKIPNQTVSAPISQSHYAIGARYRFGVGETSSLAVGLDYARRQYVADRSGLMAAVLDAPDVDYAAVVPGAALRVPVAASVTVFAGADGLLIFDAGGIQKSASYGPATVYGFEGTAGADIALTRQIGLRVALEYSQIMFSFTPKGPTMANNRDSDPSTQDVNGATDRSIGVTVTLGLAY